MPMILRVLSGYKDALQYHLRAVVLCLSLVYNIGGLYETFLSLW
jgi:hypothetical protein